MPIGVYNHYKIKGNTNGFKKGYSFWKGKKRPAFSEEWKEKISLNNARWNLGKKLSEETIRKISINRTGKYGAENSSNWKGGISPINAKIRASIVFREWKVSVFKRDDFTCKMPGCNKRGGELNAHHIKRFTDYPELRTDINNGITLCEKHHNKTKGREKLFEVLFLKIIS